MADNITINIIEPADQNVTIGISSTPDIFSVNAFSGGAVWGNIIGTLSAQTDLWSELSAKALQIDLNSLSSQFIFLNTLIQTYSATWEESAEIIPTVTNYLSTNFVNLCSIDSKGQILSAGIPLHNIFLTSETDSQTLSYIPSSYLLSISNGNTVNLSSINSLFGEVSGKYESVYSNVVSNSANWNYAYDTATTYSSISSSFATNTALNAASSVLLPTSIYQNASGNWQGTYTTVQSNSANWNFGYDVATYVQANSASWEESAEIIPTVTNYLSTNNVLISSLRVSDRLTVTGNISATGTIYAQQGNSGEWISKNLALAYSIAL